MKYRHLKGYKYELLETVMVFTGIKDEVNQLFADPEHVGVEIDTRYIALFSNGQLFIKARYAWDGASGPAIDTKTFMRGSLVHDALYQLMREGHLDRKYRKRADQLLREICLEDGMWNVRAAWVYWAVQTFAKREVYPRKKPRGKIVEI